MNVELLNKAINARADHAFNKLVSDATKSIRENPLLKSLYIAKSEDSSCRLEDAIRYSSDKSVFMNYDEVKKDLIEKFTSDEVTKLLKTCDSIRDFCDNTQM
jgi:hypothetical protein